MRRFFLLLSFWILNQVAIAQDEVANKRYSLFKPVPKESMREMQTDRPDVTESAYSVDAGHFQYETDLFKTIRNKQGEILNVQNVYNHANIKLGLTNSTDIQLVIESVVENRDLINQQWSSSTGFGDITLRIKQNFWGNNHGKTAFAMMPYINFPTSKFSESKVEYGIVFPLAVELKNDWGFGTQLQADMLKGKSDKSYTTELLYSFTVSRKLASRIDGFAESYYTYNFKENVVHVSVNGGLVFSLSDDFKLDAGFNYGLTKASDKVYFTGLSFRY